MARKSILLEEADSARRRMNEIDLQVASLLPLELREFCENVALETQRRKLWTELSLSAEVLVSYLFGSIFGRWDIRYATGERPAPEMPDPFAPLPICPPGMIQGEDCLPLTLDAGRQLRINGHYPLDIAWVGILVDDSGLSLRVVGTF